MHNVTQKVEKKIWYLGQRNSQIFSSNLAPYQLLFYCPLVPDKYWFQKIKILKLFFPWTKLGQLFLIYYFDLLSLVRIVEWNTSISYTLFFSRIFNWREFFRSQSLKKHWIINTQIKIKIKNHREEKYSDDFNKNLLKEVR